MFKMNENHWVVLLDYMENHPTFARGQFSGPTGKVSQRKMWEELSQRLNALGYGAKSVEKWQKTWADIKYMIKKKATINNKEFIKTGGGIGSQIKLTPYEERILAILGKSFCEGVGSVEIGIAPIDNTPNNNSLSTNVYPSFNQEFEIISHNNSPSTVASSLSKNLEFEAGKQIDYGIGSKPPLIKSNQKVFGAEEKNTAKTPSDHDYYKNVSKKRKITSEDVENHLYKETLDELIEIKRGVFEVSNNLSDINKTLKELKESIFDSKK